MIQSNVRKVTDQSIKRICWILASHGKIFSLIMWSRPWCTWECRRLCAGNAQPWACGCSGIHILLPHGLWPDQALHKGLELQYQLFLAANVALKQPWVPWNWLGIFTGSHPRHNEGWVMKSNFHSLLCFLEWPRAPPLHSWHPTSLKIPAVKLPCQAVVLPS